jgi:hypothetical protein
VKLVYISGPYSSKWAYVKARNIHRAWEAALALWAIPGVYAICPHTNTMNMDGVASPDPEEDYRKFIQADLDLIGRCDAVMMMRGWQSSRGAVLEHDLALRLGKKVFYQDRGDGPDAVADWANAQEEVEPEVIQVGPVS